MKEKKGIAGLFLAGVLLANGTAVSAAEVKNLEVNRMPSGDMAEYTPSKPMELLSGQDAAELEQVLQIAHGKALYQITSMGQLFHKTLLAKIVQRLSRRRFTDLKPLRYLAFRNERVGIIIAVHNVTAQLR